MTSKERLLAALNKTPVDRIPVNFYETGGFDADTEDSDPFNIYSSPSWKTLLKLARERTDLIWMREPRRMARSGAWNDLVSEEMREEGESRIMTTSIRIGDRELKQIQRRDRDMDTVWTVQHFAEDPELLDLLLELPVEFFRETLSADNLLSEEEKLGDRGLVMVDVPDPLCIAAGFFEFGAYTIAAMTEKEKFHRLLEKILPAVLEKTEFTARNFPGRLWRIYGPEYATPPYLPAELFREYVCRYTGEMVKIIKKHGGYVRLHSHGKVRGVLEDIAGMGADALDPVEPPHQGDTDLKEAVREFGSRLTFFGNIEITDLENLPREEFRTRVRQTLEDAAGAPGFVLMPSASPYGRDVPDRTIENYEVLLEEAGA